MHKEGDEQLVKTRSILRNKQQQFEVLQKEFEALQSTLRNKQQQFEALQKEFEALQKEFKALQSTLRNKQQQFEALQKEVKAQQKEIEDLSAAALPILDMISPIEPRTAPTSTLDRLCQAPSVLRPFCETLIKMCVKHVLVLMKSWWPALDIRRLRGINPAIPPEKFWELRMRSRAPPTKLLGTYGFRLFISSKICIQLEELNDACIYLSVARRYVAYGRT